MLIAVVGVGLIGGSAGLAARERLGARVRGFDRRPAELEAALAHGAIDEAADSIAAAVAGADAVLVAVPVGVLAATVGEVMAAAGPDCVVTDAGSTKRAIVAAHDDERFVGGHPLAGAETAGVAHARADLFAGATWYLTPTERTSGVLYERLYRIVVGLGGRPVAIDAAGHDEMMAVISHLPHVLANVLVAQAADALASDDGQRVPATGPSFRDATRVAGANSAIWTDIYLSNRDALVPALDETLRRLTAARDALAAGDRDAVEGWNDAARGDRERLLETGLAGGPLHELRVSVPNEPGVVATIALELGGAGIDIADLALYPAQDRRSGVIALWIAGDEPARRAEALCAARGLPVARA